MLKDCEEEREREDEMILFLFGGCGEFGGEMLMKEEGGRALKGKRGKCCLRASKVFGCQGCRGV